MDNLRKEVRAIVDLSKPRLQTRKIRARWISTKLNAPPQMMRVKVQTASSRINSKLSKLKTITNWAHLTLQTTSDLEEQEEVERALEQWSTTRSYSKSTLKGHCWYMEENSTFAVGYCGTMMERSTYLKRATCEHQANPTKSIQIIQMTCLRISQTMLSRRQVKIMEPLKMAIKLATQHSRSIANRRPKTLD